MQYPPYAYRKHHFTRYSFVSSGKRPIEKVVEFAPLAVKNMYNMGFGDLMADGSVNDSSNSNNGDIVKVMATVVAIANDFITLNPSATIAFTGSTAERTSLYHRILKTYFEIFSKEFLITALNEKSGILTEVLLDPKTKDPYVTFFIKRKQ